MRRQENGDVTFRGVFECIERFLLRWAKLLARVSIVAIVVLLILYHYHLLPLLSWENAFGFLLILMLVVVERLVVLERRLSEPFLQCFTESGDAYEALSTLVRKRRVKRADLIQFSGHTVLGLLRTLAETSPGVKVRLLLQQPEVAETFDKSDQQINHKGRIETTLSQITLFHEHYSDSGFHVDHRFYRTPASLSAALIDNDLVVVGWYHYYEDKKTDDVRIRGHNALAFLTEGSEASPSRDFVRQQFDRLWDPLNQKVEQSV